MARPIVKSMYTFKPPQNFVFNIHFDIYTERKNMQIFPIFSCTLSFCCCFFFSLKTLKA